MYSIWLLPNVTQALENTITSYQFHETQILGNYHRNKESYDIMQFIIVGLGEKAEQEPYGAQRLLSVLLAQDTTRREKADIFGEYDIPINSKSEEAMNDMCNLSQGLVETGKKSGALEMLIDLVKDNVLSIDDAAKRIGLSVEEFQKIMNDSAN